jgi:hypothetical protein
MNELSIGQEKFGYFNFLLNNWKYNFFNFFIHFSSMH